MTALAAAMKAARRTLDAHRVEAKAARRAAAVRQRDDAIRQQVMLRRLEAHMKRPVRKGFNFPTN